MDNFKDYYKILGVNPDSEKSEIINSYKNLAKKTHPDLNKDSDSTAWMQDLNEAYYVLCNKELKTAFDKIYYTILNEKTVNNIKSQTSNNICYYCKRNLSINKFNYSKNIYLVTKIEKTPSRRIFFDVKTVYISRCEECFKFHQSNYKYLKKIPLIAYFILGFIWGIYIFEFWFFALILGLLIGNVSSYILSKIDFFILPQNNKILHETDIDNFIELKRYIRDGWVKTKPI